MDTNLKGFDQVWDRVMKEKDHGQNQTHTQNANNSPESAEAQRLRFFMDKENEAAAIYMNLARRSRSRQNANIFMSIARDEQRHLKILQSVYFLLTGDSYRPKTPQVRNQGMLTMLRQQYKSEVASAEGYENAAHETEIPNLAQIYKKTSAEEWGHVKTIEGMIRRQMN